MFTVQKGQITTKLIKVSLEMHRDPTIALSMSLKSMVQREG